MENASTELHPPDYIRRIIHPLVPGFGPCIPDPNLGFCPHPSIPQVALPITWLTFISTLASLLVSFIFFFLRAHRTCCCAQQTGRKEGKPSSRIRRRRPLAFPTQGLRFPQDRALAHARSLRHRTFSAIHRRRSQYPPRGRVGLLFPAGPFRAFLPPLPPSSRLFSNSLPSPMKFCIWLY